MGNARASTWDKREVEQPTSFRLTLITLNLGSWRQKGKGITMNTINGMTFYDALTKFIIGFLITFLWLPGIINSGSCSCSCGVSLNAVQTFLYVILCFIAGFIWEALCDFCRYVVKGNFKNFCCNLKFFLNDLGVFLFGNTRNNEEWIKRAKTDFTRKKRHGTVICHNYYMAYYNKINTPASSIKILEAHEAFLHKLIYIMIILSVVLNFCVSCPNIKKIIDSGWFNPLCPLMFFFLFYAWRKVQFKIHELVWEADYYNEKQK